MCRDGNKYGWVSIRPTGNEIELKIETTKICLDTLLKNSLTALFFLT